jgi:hypothetical protein
VVKPLIWSKEMTPKEIESARKKGRLCYRPKINEVEGRKFFKTSDGVEYEIKNGTAQAVIPRQKLSKKDRRKMRLAMGV